jgi:hypothetical protein
MWLCTRRAVVILLDLPESPLKLSSGGVTDLVARLSSPSSVSEGLPGLLVSVQESERPSSLTASSSFRPSYSASQYGCQSRHNTRFILQIRSHNRRQLSCPTRHLIHLYQKLRLFTTVFPRARPWIVVFRLWPLFPKWPRLH